MDNREVVNYIRDMLEVASRVNGKYENIVEELEAEAEYSLKVIQNIIDGMAKQLRLWLTNNMDKLIETGAVNGKYSVERLIEIRALFEDFAAWVERPLVVLYANTEAGTPEIALPPIVIASRRGNPPVQWGIPQPEVVVEEPPVVEEPVVEEPVVANP